MLHNFMHRWEERLSRVDTNRVTLPFEWGLDFLNHGSYSGDHPYSELLRFNKDSIKDSDRFFDPGPPTEFVLLKEDRVIFSSAIKTPYHVNNTASCRLFEPAKPNGSGIIVVPQWNATEFSHVGLCKMLSRFGFTVLRLTLPYHEERNPQGPRADFFVSPNVGRTIQAMQQAVQDVRRSADYLLNQGIRKLGVMGSSIGSCIGFLAYLHDEHFEVGVFNHVSSFFGKVVWNGISTRHVRKGFEEKLSEPELHEAWAILSPNTHVGRKRLQNPGKRLFISARYDLTFPQDLARLLFAEHDKFNVPYETAYLPCGHYTSAIAPFKYLDGYHITQHFRKYLR
jgi:dienelactone hydrolase